MNAPQIGWASIWHSRLRPVQRAFTYPAFFLWLPMRTMHRTKAADGAVPHNRAGLISFHDRDHGDGRASALEWLDELLQNAGIVDATGEAWLHCFPRVLGYVFKPVSFWFCHREDGSLRAIVAEVNNTFGERHCYVLDGPAWGREQSARKVFHVSPFREPRGQYRFRFMVSADGHRTLARIDHDDADGPLLRTAVSGRLEPATRKALRRALWRFPLLTVGIVARIHWQALRLWAAGVPIHPHTPAPSGRPSTSR